MPRLENVQSHMVHALLIAGLCLADPPSAPSTPATPPAEERRLPSSLERVREGLRRPQGLRLPPPEVQPPQFRVEITVEGWNEPSILERIGQELRASAPFSPRSAGIDLLGLANSLKDRISSARRAQAERNARRLVHEELTAFCAEHDCSVEERSNALDP